MTHPNMTLEGDLPEFKGQVVDVYEDFCDDNAITIRNEDREEYNRESGYEDGENVAIIFGEDYDEIADRIEGFVLTLDSPFPREEVKRIALSCTSGFNGMLKERGSRTLTEPESQKLTAQIVEIFDRWEVVA